MPRLDLIILPLIAGYIFLCTFNLTKYYNIRVDKQRLIFNSLIVSVILTITAFLFDYIILQNYYSFASLQSFPQYRKNTSEFIDNVLGKNNIVFGLKHFILIFLASYPLGKFLNIIFHRKYAFDFTIQKWGNQLDRIFWFSITEKKDENKLLMITTKSNKVYIGYVTKISEPLGESHIRIIPNFSGYRNKDNLRIDITTIYTDVIKEYIKSNRKKEIDEKLGIIIPVNEILIVSKFDSDIFGRFNNSENDKNNLILSQKLYKGFESFFKELFR